MRDLLNATGIANRVLMRRGARPSASFLVVEGEDDHKLYSRLAHEEQCGLQVAYGKPMVLATMSILSSRGMSGSLAIVDADFDRLEGTLCSDSNIVVTDYHDAECMLIDSPALEEVLREFGATVSATLVRAQLVGAGRVIGQLRLASSRLGWCLRFDDLPTARFVDQQTMVLDPNAMIEVVRGHQGGRIAPPGAEELRTMISKVVAEAHDDLQLCNGHDLQRLLALGLRTCWARNRPSEVTEARIAASLRLACHLSYLEATKVAEAIRAWEARNAPYVVCRLTHALRRAARKK